MCPGGNKAIVPTSGLPQEIRYVRIYSRKERETHADAGRNKGASNVARMHAPETRRDRVVLRETAEQ